MQTTSQLPGHPHRARLAGGLLTTLAIAALSVPEGRTQHIYTNPYTVTTWVGDHGFGSADGSAGEARFALPVALAVDAAGNVYVAEIHNQTVRKVTPAGEVTTLAGLGMCSGSDDGVGREARFSAPQGLAIDSTGNIFVADTWNSTIRKITRQGTHWVVTTLAGLAGARGSTDGTGSAARFSSPCGLAVTSAGDLYVTESGNNTIRKVTASGEVTTLAGLAGTSGSADGTGSNARFNTPTSVSLDSQNNLYVTDWSNHTLRKITPDGTVTTLAGLAGTSGSANGTGSGARFDCPAGACVDTNGNIFVAEFWNFMIRKVTPAGYVTTVAGLTDSPGTNNALGTAARFNCPYGMAVDALGNLYVADVLNNTIRKMTPTGSSWSVTTLAGLAVGSVGSANGSGKTARFHRPRGLAADGQGNLYVSEAGNHTIRKVTAAGLVTTLAGLAGQSGSANGTGSAARFNVPGGVGVDGAGVVYVADSYNHTIRKITPAGLVSTLAGYAGSPGSSDGTGSAARFYNPAAVAADLGGTVYVADLYNHTIRRITPSGTVTTLAGFAGSSGSTDGTGSGARFYRPYGIAVDGSGNVYVAEHRNFTIRKVTPLGEVTTLAGKAGNLGWCDASGTSARFGYLKGIAVDSRGSLYVSDSGNCLLRKLTPVGGDWVVTTVAGYGGVGGWDGTGKNASFDSLESVVVDAADNVYVAEYNGHTIRKGFPASSVTPPVLQPPGLSAGRFGFGLTGQPNVWVNLETSSDLATWRAAGACVLENGSNSFSSPDPLAGTRFYRAQVR